MLQPNKIIGSSTIENNLEKYNCKYCEKKFKICAALGGHISKAHPGQSASYNHKKRVREERQLERELHKRAIAEYRARGREFCEEEE